MQDVAAGEDAGNRGLARLVDGGAAGHRVERDARRGRELVLGEEPDGKHQRVARDRLLGTGDRRARGGVHFGDDDALNALLAEDAHDGVVELERDAVVDEALHDVAVQARGIRHELGDELHLGALPRHAARHDEPDVAAAEDDDLAPGEEALHVHEPLRAARGVDAGRARAGDRKRAARALAAAHREDDRAGAEAHEAALRVHADDLAVLRDGENHRVGPDFGAGLLGLLHEAARVFGPGELFAEVVQAEAVVDALAQDAARGGVALQDDDARVRPRLARRDRGGEAGGTAADDGDVADVAIVGSQVAGRRSQVGPLAVAVGFRTWDLGLGTCDPRRADHEARAPSVLRQRGERAGELAGEDLHHAGRAEAALAAAHASAGAALDGVERCRAAADGVDDLRLGDGLAPADDATVERVRGDGGGALGVIHAAERNGAFAERVPVRAFAEGEARLGEEAFHHLGDGGRAREAGRADAGGEDEPRARGAAADDEVAFARLRAQSGEERDRLAEVEIGDALEADLLERRDAFGRDGGVRLALLVDRGRSGEGVAVDGGRNEDALAELRGAREEHARERRGGAVEQEVFALARVDRERVVAEQARDVVREDAGGVDDEPRAEGFGAGVDFDRVPEVAHRAGGRAELPDGAVCAGVLGAGDAKLVWAGDRGRGRPERGKGLLREARLQRAGLVAGDDAQVRDAVRLAAREEVAQRCLVVGRERGNERAAAAVGDRELAAPVLEDRVAADVEAGHERAGLRVEAGVDDGGVGARGAGGDVLRGLDERDLQIKARKVAGDGAAGRASADDGEVEFHAAYPFTSGL